MTIYDCVPPIHGNHLRSPWQVCQKAKNDAGRSLQSIAQRLMFRHLPYSPRRTVQRSRRITDIRVNGTTLGSFHTGTSERHGRSHMGVCQSSDSKAQPKYQGRSLLGLPQPSLRACIHSSQVTQQRWVAGPKECPAHMPLPVLLQVPSSVKQTGIGKPHTVIASSSWWLTQQHNGCAA